MNNLSPYRPLPHPQPFLLASDIDGTLLGDETGEAWLHDLATRFRRSFKLAYITGRHRASVLQLIDENRLPRPDYICSEVGTELLDLNDPHNQLGLQYAAQVAPEWDLEQIYTLGEGPGIRRQDFPDGQPRFQAGFFWDADPQTLSAFYARLTDLEQYAIYPSSNVFIDVIPHPLGKGGVVKFLQKQLALDPARIVVAGDTGNDRQMFETGFKGIIPSNALDELKTATSQPWHYHSLLPAARGVLDGLLYFGFLKKWSEYK
jgi:sucrose-6-phosphatase